MGPDLWSEGAPNSGIVMATSPDGLDFTLRSGPEINGGDEGGQTYYPEDPSVLVDGSGWSLYFSKYLSAGPWVPTPRFIWPRKPSSNPCPHLPGQR